MQIQNKHDKNRKNSQPSIQRTGKKQIKYQKQSWLCVNDKMFQMPLRSPEEQLSKLTNIKGIYKESEMWLNEMI